MRQAYGKIGIAAGKDLIPYLDYEGFRKQLQKNFDMKLYMEPRDEQEEKIIGLLKDYTGKSTSGNAEARTIIKAQIRTDLLTGFNLYEVNEEGQLGDIAAANVKLADADGFIDEIVPFSNPDCLTPKNKFDILLYRKRTQKSDGRDGAFRRLLEEYPYHVKSRSTGIYSSMAYEYQACDINEIFDREKIVLSFSDKLEILCQMLYEDIYGLKQIDILANSDINEVGFSNDGRYVYCWCGIKVWLSFILISENDARMIQDRAISFDKFGRQLDSSCPEVLCHRGDGARITVTQKPYFSARNLCIRVFNHNRSAFSELISHNKLSTLVVALVKAGECICLQGGLGTGKTTTMNIMYELLDDFLHIGTVEDYFEQHIMERYPNKRIVEGQAVNDKKLLDVVKTMLRMSVDVANLGEVRDGDALYSFIQLVQSISVAAWFTTHITNPETTVPRLKNMLTGTGRYFSEQSAVMDIIHSINIIFQHEIIDGRITISEVVEIVPLTAFESSVPYGYESSLDTLERLSLIQQIQSNPYNMFKLNKLMRSAGGEPRFLNYPSVRMLEKALKNKDGRKYMKQLLALIREDTGKPIPDYAMELMRC